MKKIFYGLLISLALVIFTPTLVLAGSDAPDCTDTPQLPPTETNVPPPTETRLPPPSETVEPTPSSPPPPTETTVPLSEPTPTIEVDPTPAETNVPGRPNKPTPVETLPVTGGGDNFFAELSWTLIGGLLLIGLYVMAKAIRYGNHL